MIVVLAFCGYLASLGGPGPYIGGLIAILDLLVMLALFFGLRPDHLTDSSRPRKRRLIQAACRRLSPAAEPVPRRTEPPGAGRSRGAQRYRRPFAWPAGRISATAWSAGRQNTHIDMRAPARRALVMAPPQPPRAHLTGSADVLLDH